MALNANTTASNNTAVGYQAAYVSTGANNSAFGSQALLSNTTGTLNSAIGQQSLRANTTGASNTAVGVNNTYSNTSGNYNTAVGDSALFNNTTADDNTAVGYQAGYAITTGGYNVAFGKNAGDTITTGTGNTILGFSADSGTAAAVNRIALGNQVVATADNRITVGAGANVAELDLNGSDTSWAASSDARLKENVKDNTAGLALINDLRTVTFNWKRKKDVPQELIGCYADSDERIHGFGDETYLSFIAQEAQETITKHSADVVRLVRSRENGILIAAPGALIPVLVKAIQELKAEFDAYKASHP